MTMTNNTAFKPSLWLSMLYGSDLPIESYGVACHLIVEYMQVKTTTLSIGKMELADRARVSPKRLSNALSQLETLGFIRLDRVGFSATTSIELLSIG